MCGIAGAYSRDGTSVDAGHVGAMCDLLAHRGPDDSGLWADGPIALGHRRLSIIDLSVRGRNPMSNEDGTVRITYNGEIYNYQEIRRELLDRGHRFKSDTDTEVIIHLYEEKGPACVEDLNGMFAFALWDARREELLLARDRFGVKPLYYTELGNTLAFASEAKAFLCMPGFEARADVFGLAEHLTFQNTFGSRTMFEGVHMLPAGHYLVCGRQGARRHQFWDLRYEPDETLSAREWAHGLRERFEAAVARQLRSDVPVGAYLSGGMDTGAISAVAARRIDDMHTFTCGFDLPDDVTGLEQYFDERQESHGLARYLGTEHHELLLGPDAMPPSLATVTWHLDEPRVGISYQVWYTARMIKQFVPVVLSGVGGDELFAGYPWRYEPILDLQGAAFDDAYYGAWIRFLTDDEKRALFTDEVNAKLGGFSTRDSFDTVMKDAGDVSPLHKALYFDFKTFLNGLLTVDDKLSMAHSVEARVPFLDNELVDFARRMPARHKLAGGQSKIALRKAMAGLIPDKTLARRKQGFTPPDETWYRERHMQFIRDLILGRRALFRGYFRPDGLRQVLDDHVSGKRNNRFLLWSLMCFEWWNRLFVDREPVPPVDTVAEGRAARSR